MGIKQRASKAVPNAYALVKRTYWNHLIERHKSMNETQAERELCRLYRQRMGFDLDLGNPQRYTEKIQWCKLHAMTPLKSRLADKCAVRSWVSEKIGPQYLIPLLGVWERAEDVDFDALPEAFVLKTNHASGTNIIVPDKRKLNRDDALSKLDRWLGFDVGWVFFEMQYLRIRPLIIAEQFMANPDGSEINGYKFICFDGKARFIRVDLGRHGDHTRVTFDTEWNVLPWVEGDYRRPAALPERPKDLGKLIHLVETLADGFACVRVDFYVIGGKYYFGEMTFSSAGGYERICPDEYDFALGKEWNLPKEARADFFSEVNQTMTGWQGSITMMTGEAAEGCASLVSEGSKIGLIGRIDPKCTLMDGQTVKTRTIYELLVEAYGKDGVVTVDTINYRHEPLRVARELRLCLRSCDSIMVLLSSGGRKALFPILSREAQRHGKRIYHNLIGGHLAEDVAADQSGRLAGYLRSFQVNWVESNALVAQLEGLGVPNAEFLPNFKLLPKVEPFEAYRQERPFRFVMFSRVQPEKGVEVAARAVASINARAGEVIATLDIYGPIKEGYEEAFQKVVSETSNVAYKGSVDASESIKTLMGYSCLLFPTSWPGEGMPGTVIDALSAGLPIVASRWRCYDEMLEDGKTGLSYAYDRPQDLKKTIEAFMALDDATLLSMKNEALARAGRYSAEEAFVTMVKRIEGDRGRAR